MRAKPTWIWPLALLAFWTALALNGCTPAPFPGRAASATPPPAATASVNETATATVSASAADAGSVTVTSAPSAVMALTAAASPAIPTALPSATIPATSTAVPSATQAPAAPTASPTPRPAASATSGPTIPVAPALAGAMHDYVRPFMGLGPANSLSRALTSASEIEVSRQHFGPYTPNLSACHSADSLMLWRKDTGQIYFLVSGNTGLHFDACADTWEVFADTWQPGEPNNEDLTAPAGKVVPRNGFGKLWREHFRLRDASLGYPSQPESYTSATVQRFEHGTAFAFHDTGEVFVLFDDFRYQTRSGIDTGRVWFQGG